MLPFTKLAEYFLIKSDLTVKICGKVSLVIVHNFSTSSWRKSNIVEILLFMRDFRPFFGIRLCSKGSILGILHRNWIKLFFGNSTTKTFLFTDYIATLSLFFCCHFISFVLCCVVHTHGTMHGIGMTDFWKSIIHSFISFNPIVLFCGYPTHQSLFVVRLSMGLWSDARHKCILSKNRKCLEDFSFLRRKSCVFRSFYVGIARLQNV